MKVICAIALPLIICVSLSAGSPACPESYILTPKPGPLPKINGPVVYGVRPGRPFLYRYRIPCTGQRSIRLSAGGLPASLSLNAGTGVITGKAGSYQNASVL